MDIMTHAKFYFNRLMLTLIFAIWASEPPRAWRTTKKAGPDRVKGPIILNISNTKAQLLLITTVLKFLVYANASREKGSYQNSPKI